MCTHTHGETQEEATSIFTPLFEDSHAHECISRKRSWIPVSWRRLSKSEKWSSKAVEKMPRRIFTYAQNRSAKQLKIRRKNHLNGF
jgi:hypothetical protein